MKTNDMLMNSTADQYRLVKNWNVGLYIFKNNHFENSMSARWRRVRHEISLNVNDLKPRGKTNRNGAENRSYRKNMLKLGYFIFKRERS